MEKGAWRDNVFVERLWRTIKYKEVYLRAYDSVSVAQRKPAPGIWHSTTSAEGRIHRWTGKRPIRHISNRRDQSRWRHNRAGNPLTKRLKLFKRTEPPLLASEDGAFQKPISSWQEFSITTYALFVANFESVRVHCGTEFFDTHLYLEHRSQEQWEVLANPKDQLLNEIFWEWAERPAEKTGYGIHRKDGSAVVYFGAEDDADFAVAVIRGNALVAKIFSDDEVAQYYVEGLSEIGFRAESGPSNAGEPQVVSLATQVDPKTLSRVFAMFFELRYGIQVLLTKLHCKSSMVQ